jgi:hypothetical protein
VLSISAAYSACGSPVVRGGGSVYVIMVAGEACRRYVESDIAAAGNLTDICLSRYIDK